MKDYMNQFGIEGFGPDDAGRRRGHHQGRRGGHHPDGGFGRTDAGEERGFGPRGGFGPRDGFPESRDERHGPRDERHESQDERRGAHEGRQEQRRERREARRGFGFGAGFGGPGAAMGGFEMGPELDSRGPRGGRGGRRGPGRGRKGDVRNAVLALLAEQQLNGYGLITAIAERSNGLWRPSAGSIYPALGLLEDEGLIEPTEADGKKVYRLTEAGTAHAAEHAEELDSPWDKVSEPHRGFLDVRGDMQQLGMAVQQVVVAGDAAQVEAARKILERARKDIYRLLAGDAEA